MDEENTVYGMQHNTMIWTSSSPQQVNKKRGGGVHDLMVKTMVLESIDYSYQDL